MHSSAWAQEVDARILGPLQLQLGGAVVTTGGPQARVVLARLLADAGSVVSVDRLEEALWGDEPPPSAGVTLRAYLSRLRSAFAGGAPHVRLRTVAPGYLLDIATDALDAARFERGVAAGRELLARGDARGAAAALDAALGEWRGEVLADLRDRPFVAPLAARLDGLRLAATEDLFEARLALGEHQGILPALEAHAEEHPTRERAWALRMWGLYQAGRQADALEAYRRIRRHLARELGIEPGPALEETQRRILRHELAVPAPSAPVGSAPRAGAGPGARLPAHTTSFVGRADALGQIRAALAPGVLVTLVGVGGVGKTRLAIEAARGAAGWDANDDGSLGPAACFVDLSAVPANAAPAAVAATIAAATGLPIGSEDDVVGELGRRLASADVVLLLDNCEHVLDGVAIVVSEIAAAVSAPGGPRMLATSRSPIHLPGEVVIEVRPLTIDSIGGGVGRGDAVALLADRLGAVTGSRTTATEAMARLCRRLDGLPLAIELAAAQARLFSVEEIDARLGDRLTLLRAWSRAAPPRHATLRAALDWSYELLDPVDRDVMAATGAFRGTFGVDDVARVVEAAGITDASAGELALGRLVDASLIVRREGPALDRFTLLETVRDDAAERLAGSGREPAVREAHARRVLEIAERLSAARDTPAEAAAFDRLERLVPDVRSALDWSLRAHPSVSGVRLARAMGDAWRIRGFLEEGRRETEQALALLDGAPGVEGDDDRLRASLMLNLGTLAARATDLERAERLLRHAATLADGDGRLRGACLHALAFVQRTAGAAGEARRTLAETIPLRRDAGDLAGLAWSIGNLADIASFEGDYALAARLYDEGGLVVAAAGDPPALTIGYLESRARLALLREDGDGARVLGAAALEAARALGDVWHVALSHAVLGAVSRSAGETDEAERHAHESFRAFSRLGEQAGRAESAELLAGVLLDRGEARAASVLLAAAAAARDRSGVPPDVGRARILQADRERARADLGGDALRRAAELGGALTLDAAVAAVAATTRSP